jgi:hypothetical protein
MGLTVPASMPFQTFDHSARIDMLMQVVMGGVGVQVMQDGWVHTVSLFGVWKMRTIQIGIKWIALPLYRLQILCHTILRIE